MVALTALLDKLQNVFNCCGAKDNLFLASSSQKCQLYLKNAGSGLYSSSEALMFRKTLETDDKWTLDKPCNMVMRVETLA